MRISRLAGGNKLIVMMKRRDFLAGTAILVLSTMNSRATVISGALPWAPNAGNPPVPVRPGPWHYFTSDEGRAVEALAERLIPPDPQTPGGKESGCAVFIDRQLAGPYGHSEGHYTQPPFMPGTRQQGSQSEHGPAAAYRAALAALDRHCQAKYQGKRFPDLSDAEKDELLQSIEDGKTSLEGVDGKSFFALVVKDSDHASRVLEADIKAHLQAFAARGVISKYGIPEKILFIDSIPKTSVGKINKKELRERYADM